MAPRSWISWLVLLCLGLLAFWTGATVFQIWMMAPALAKALDNAFGQAVTALAAELAICISLIGILGIAFVVITRGPIVALAWAAILFASWQQGW
jgi:hypothetical protein